MALKHGDSGNNTISGNYGEADTLYGNLGSDNISGLDKNDIIFGGRGVSDSQDGNDTIYGGDGQDSIYANAGNDLVYGGGSNPGDWSDDLIYGGNGNDTIYGGNGAADPTDGSDNIYGNYGHDLIFGNAGGDYIYGGEGNDTMYGGKGSDVITPGEGRNVSTGGEGNDYFMFSAHWMLEGGHDIVTDFKKGEDLVVLPFDVDASSLSIHDEADGTHIFYAYPQNLPPETATIPEYIDTIRILLQGVHGVTMENILINHIIQLPGGF